MKKNICQHHNIRVIEETAFDKVGLCEDCGIKIPILYLKEGLYAIGLGDTTYLVNSTTAMNLDDMSYQFQVRNSEQVFNIYKEKENSLKNIPCKQLCKNMKNS